MGKKKPTKAQQLAKERIAEAMEIQQQREEMKARRSARRQAEELHGHRKREKMYQQEIDHLEDRLRIALDLREDTAEYRPIRVRRREQGAIRDGTAVLLYSDIHPEEIVHANKVSGLNEFNPKIAEQRIERLVVGVRWMLEMIRHRQKHAGYQIKDFILALLGDLISNSIHEDLAESNAMGPAEAVLFVFELIQTVIDALLEDKELERIIIPCVMGNHDRMTKDYRHHTKYETSLATIIYNLLAKVYRDEKRVEFDIARGNMLYTEIYGKNIRWTHGDDIRYNGGVGGLTIPMRKAIDSWNKSVDAALTCAGHFHTITDHRDFVVNGSVVGYSSFAQAIKARFEPAAQAFFVIDPEHGKRLFTGIDLQDSTEWS